MEARKEKEALKMMKSIMCPLKEKCANDQRLRWPYSSVKGNQPFGKKCPFAHHSSELWFPQWDEQNRGIEEKKLGLEKLKNEENPRDPWMSSGVVKDMLSQQYNKKVKKTMEEATMEKVYHRPKKDMMSQ